MERLEKVKKIIWVCVLLLVSSVATSNILISVVEPSPEVAVMVTASAKAAVNNLEETEVEVDVVTAAVDANEVLDVPTHICAAAEKGAHAVITGVSGGAALGGAAAARAGLAVLLAGDYFGGGMEALSLYPSPDVLLQAAKDLLREKDWREAALLHAGSAQPASILDDDGRLSLVARQLPPSGDAAMLRDLLLVLKKSGVVKFIVWSDAPTAAQVLGAAQRAGLLAERHSFLVLSLELHTQDLRVFSHGGANITGLMMFDLESEEVKNAMTSMMAADDTWLVGRKKKVMAETLPTPFLLAYDAATITIKALLDLELSDIASGSCATGVGAFHADTLLNYLRSIPKNWRMCFSFLQKEHNTSTTGLLSWGPDGTRRGVVLQVVELERGGKLIPVGKWSASGVAWKRAPKYVPPPPEHTMANRTFNILIAEAEPYVMKKKSIEKLIGNDRYEGFCIELIDRLSKELNFNYTLILQEDRNYGREDPVTHEWNGMLREIMYNDNFHFAITDLTITAERERAVDFTTPFMNLGISILFRKPKPPGPALFAFLLPFSSGVWLGLGLALIGTSLLLYVVGRLCPEEWQNPYPCIDEPVALENQFTIGNALWFNLGAMLLQGSEIAPVAYGTRAVAGVWWLFALVITSSYTANLATLLAKTTNDEIIKNVRELAYNEYGIDYGAKLGGSTYTFFQYSENELYQDMFEHMKTRQMPKDNPEGIEWVKTKDYALLMESTSIEYVVERDCQVYQVGDLLDSKGYGIAMRKNSPYRQELNLALLRLQEAGTLREMKQQWWEERNGGGACKPKEEFESKKLEMDSFYGLFLVLIVGCTLGVVLSCCDLAIHARKSPRAPDRPFSENFAQELRFVFRFNNSSKPLQGPLFESKSPSANSSARSYESDAGDNEAEVGAEGEEAAAEMTAEAAAEAAARCDSGMSGRGRRRRSSMHTASVRLARHARPEAR